MADVALGSEALQFLTSLRLVKDEVNNSLEQAVNQIDAYAENGNPDNFVAFLEEIQQLRGTFKMIDFRGGERLCEEIVETSRAIRNQTDHEPALQTFTQALIYLKRFLDCASDETPISASLLVPVINSVRKERNETLLPEAYFFLTNLRPRITPPKAITGLEAIPYRRARQLFQLGLIGLIRKEGHQGPVQLMSRAISRFEQMSRGTPSWVFWYVVVGALEALSQPSFEHTPQRIRLLRILDIQVKNIQLEQQKAFAKKAPDWLFKEFLYFVALAEPDAGLIKEIKDVFQLNNVVREKELSATRQILRGPDHSAMASLSQALHEEMQTIKDLIDLFERTEIDEQNFVELQTSLTRITDTLEIANLTDVAEQTLKLTNNIKATGSADLKDKLVEVADQIIQIEQKMLALAHGKLDTTALVDPVSLKEARVAVILESMAALSMIKRAISSYLDSNNDKMHIQNIGKSLLDVAGAFFFLEERKAYKVALELQQFVKIYIIEINDLPSTSQIEAFADVVSALEFYLDSLQNNAVGAQDALKLSIDGMQQLRV